MPTKISILVYVGDPVDYIEYRHTALYVEFHNGTKSTMHVTGAHGFFRFEQRTDYNPDFSARLARRIPVAELPDTVSAASVSTVIFTTPVKNSPEDADWNCQTWVGDALTRLASYGYLNEPQREAGIDEMVNACLEARGE